MMMPHLRFALVALVLVVAASPARADVSVYLGPQFLTDGAARSAGGTVQTNVGLRYDLSSAPVVPVRAFVAADESFGSSNGGGLNTFGAGIGARLTTPVYLGASLDLYNVNLRQPAGSTSTTGVGSDFFLGSKLASFPGGASLAWEASYKIAPQANGVSPNAFGIGLRLGL